MSTEQDILKSFKIVAVVGLSANKDRPSHEVAKYLRSHGYKIIPVNPKEVEVLGQTCYPDLKSVPVKVDVVNIFRRSEDVPPIIDQAIEIGAAAVWMQEGIRHEQAAEKARLAGLKVVQDRCMLKEHIRMYG